MFNCTLPLHKTTPSSVIQSFRRVYIAQQTSVPTPLLSEQHCSETGWVMFQKPHRYNTKINQWALRQPLAQSPWQPCTPSLFQSLPLSLFLSVSETVRVTAVLYQSHSKDITIPSHGSQILHTQLQCRRWERAGYRQPPRHTIQMWNACHDSTRHDTLQHHYYYIAV